MSKKHQKSSSDSDRFTPEEVAVQNVLTKHLDAQVDNLDFTISSKLSAARRKAIAGEAREGHKKGGFFGLDWPGLVVASCAVVLVAFLAVQLTTVSPEMASTPVALNEPTHFVEDLNILSATDDIDFYQSVDFLEWMESNAG